MTRHRQNVDLTGLEIHTCKTGRKRFEFLRCVCVCWMWNRQDVTDQWLEINPPSPERKKKTFYSKPTATLAAPWRAVFWAKARTLELNACNSWGWWEVFKAFFHKAVMSWCWYDRENQTVTKVIPILPKGDRNICCQSHSNASSRYQDISFESTNVHIMTPLDKHQEINKVSQSLPPVTVWI